MEYPQAAVSPTPMPTTRQVMTVKKPNETIVMIPTLGKLTAAARKIFNVILHATQSQARAIESSGAEVSAKHLFKARLSAIVESAAPSGSDLRTAGKRYLKEMADVRVDWESPDDSTGVVWRNMGLLSEVEIVVEGGLAYVRWALPPSLLGAVLDPKRFTLLDIEEISKLKSYPSVALYEICARYKNNPSGVTSCNEPQWWADALTGSPKIDKKTGFRRIRDWRKVKNESVLKAIEEINNNTGIEIKLVETKTGKAVTGVQFSVKRKPLAVANEPVRAKLSADTVERAVKLRVPLQDVSNFVADGHHEDAAKAALTKLEARAGRADLPQIESTRKYFRAVAAEISGFVAEPTSPSPATTAKAPVSNSPVTPKVLSYSDSRRSEIKGELLAESMDVQKKLADAAFEQMKEKGSMAPLVSRQYLEGKWSTGILLSRMLDMYIARKYGDGWDVDPAQKEQAGAQS